MTMAPTAKRGISPGAVGGGVADVAESAAAGGTREGDFFRGAAAAPLESTAKAANSAGKLRSNLTINHRPRNRRVMLDNFLINDAEIARCGQRNQVCQRAGDDLTEL